MYKLISSNENSDIFTSSKLSITGNGSVIRASVLFLARFPVKQLRRGLGNGECDVVLCNPRDARVCTIRWSLGPLANDGIISRR